MTKSALGIDPAEYGVSDPLHAWRIRKAQREAERRDLVFLRKNPHRRFFVRAPIPYEENGWVADEHRLYALVLVRIMVETNQFHRLMISGNASALPNTESFCKSLYDATVAQTGTSAGRANIGQEDHAALLEAAGFDVNRGQQEVPDGHR